ncbi:MAG: cell division protein FtsK [Oceanospirillaceae bacterium]|uniref:DNA translocase FtsK n=1 Tax=Thalassolituus sp. UBA1505 TaxID=1947653 RepID=UPI000C39FA7B|nr:DNA translocase FtsK [Thalassolituus sp. UBA1505]MAS25518.1 cell division protein FtsK [Oceanospirillaceae bacterium]MBL34607.1 cell division protein FtsK [Oceanospirillaceae bacterium]MBS54929.1 cell division protein FtsK [Oceanospirillaceae bacterium]
MGDIPVLWSRRHDAVFVVLTLASILLLLALVTYSGRDMAWSAAGAGSPGNAVGKVGALVADILFHALGYLAYAVPLLVMAKLGQLFRKSPAASGRVWLLRGIGVLLSLSALCALAEMSIWHGDYLPVGSGGILGKTLIDVFLPLFSFAGSAILLAGILALGLMLFLEFSWLRFFDWLGGAAVALVARMAERRKEKQAGRDSDNRSVASQGSPEPAVASVAMRTESTKPAKPAVASDAVNETDDDDGQPEADLNETEKAPSFWKRHLHRKSDDGKDDKKRREAVEPGFNLPSASANTNAGTATDDIEDDFMDVPWLSDASEEAGSAHNSAPASGSMAQAEPRVADKAPAAKASAAAASPAKAQTPSEIPIQPLEKHESQPSERAKRDMQGRLFGGDDPLPSIALLDPPRTDQPHGFSAERLQELSRLLVQKLADFGVKVEVTAVAPGPVITRFEIQPAPGVKASKISNLARDLARSMAMVAVRVVEVIPGKSVMGIEVPNEDRAVVSLNEVLSSDKYDKSKSPLTLALGHDIGGNPVITDLAKMPHLLVAGTTGSGKSVGVNAMLLSLLFKSTPEELRLILVDPKMLELSVYEGIPHLLTPVITDMKEAANGLRWSVAEMERRYMLMAAMGVRNIAGYNKKVKDAIAEGKPIPDPLWQIDKSYDTTPPLLEPLPYIVIVIDEFADMMMMVGKKVEELIARIAQKARAAGIHMILATQRPSVDVITGLIKANVPTRIAFQVSSKIDSRTILDQGGAEQLLGHGDMLFMPPGHALPERVHGAFVDDDEVHRLVAEWKKRGEPDYIEEITSHGEEGSGLTLEAGDEQDDLYDQAVAFVTETGKCSISSVQRKLRIGYNRAARLVETMEASGVVSPPAHNGSREVLAGRAPQ